jgi:exodeoxyribonuclease V beta subunit
MLNTQYFDIIKSPVSGINLIEASAGTGKTYTIAGLFLRLIIEKQIDIDKILVVTFTRAATFELKERIRLKLGDALRLFSCDILTDHIKSEFKKKDPFLLDLYKKYKNKNQCKILLKNAIRDFDTAAIFTIHGFCQRILQKNAFESGMLFDTELTPDMKIFMREIAEDFWRINIYNESKVFVNYIRNIKPSITIDYLYDIIKSVDINPFIKIAPDFNLLTTQENEEELEKKYEKIFFNLVEIWNNEKDNIENILLTDKGLNRNKYRKNTVKSTICDMNDLSDKPYYASVVLFKNFVKFTTSYINTSIKKGHVPPASYFFDICEEFLKYNERLTKSFENKILKLKLNLISYFQKEEAKRKKKLNIQSFNDIILNFYYALKNDKSKNPDKNLALKIKNEFKAALIDEFQDTDPVQYDIFYSIFADKKNILFLIGDPKQAVYGFRGADIFAYIQAAKNAEYKYTLKENWRSDPELINAVTTCFSSIKLPFVYKEIPFDASFYPLNKPLNKNGQKSLIIDDKKNTGLNICFLESNDKPLNKGDTKEFFLDYFASEISKLIFLGREKRAKIGDNFVQEKDIAVLVRTNEEAQDMQYALFSYNIKAALHNIKSIFETKEAFECALVLKGVLNYTNLRSLKTAIATPMFGLNAEKLYNISYDESILEKWILKFEEYNKILKQSGFMHMFNYMILRDNFISNLTKFPDGERRASNLMHLSEILHKVFTQKKLSADGLYKWLLQKIDPLASKKDKEFFADENLLRLESDENAVKIITVHKSKGLEFPIVFLPFMFSGSSLKKSDILKFHKKDAPFETIIDIGSPNFDKAKKFAEKELLSENLRLLYVAITRAKHICFLAWGNIKNSHSSSISYIFHQPKELSEDFLIDDLNIEKKEGHALYDDLQKLSLKSEGNVKILSIKKNESFFPDVQPDTQYDIYSDNDLELKKELKVKNFSKNIKKQRGISSFSSITYENTYDLKTYFILKEEIKKNDDLLNIFTFPKGAKAGLFMHEVLEHTDFYEKNSDITKALILEKLNKYGYDKSWQDAVFSMIENLLTIKLKCGYDEIELNKVENKNRINELNFYFPLKNISAQNLASCFSENYKNHIEKMNIKTISGFMTGFIDMIFMYNEKFYLIDWKSNYLGSDIKDYSNEKLYTEMIKHDYILQYHIYLTALNKYLKKRLESYDYNRDFGSVFYIFLRGIDKNAGSDFGIFSDKPDKVLIEQLDNMVSGE